MEKQKKQMKRKKKNKLWMLQASFHSLQELETYVQQAKSLALFETGVTGAGCETTLTLVTCSYEWKEARNILAAVKVGT